MQTTQSGNSVTETGKVAKKKAGRKPSAISPTLRRAQNTAAQRLFRERKQQYIKDLELDYKRLLNERNKYCNRSEQLCKENDVLKCENWYLKGIVLSLQLVCFKSKLRIPKHTPHIDDRALQVMAETAPASIATYIDINCQYPSPTSNDNPSDYSIRPSIPSDDTSTDGNQAKPTPSPSTATPFSDLPTTTRFHHFHQDPTKSNSTSVSATNETIKLQPVLLRHDTVTNNLKAIQALRIQLRLQSALFRENSVLHSITPTPLQLSVPHDPRIDLIPTPHMRDRMIIFQDQFDLDDCLRLLVNEAFFHGGDPTVAGNWELPASFFEKYWFLTIDYTQERTSKQWKLLKASTTNTTTTDDLLPIPPSVSHDYPCQQPSGAIPHSCVSIHHQPATPLPRPTLVSNSSVALHGNSIQQASDGPVPPPDIDPYEFMLLQDNATLYHGLDLASIQQAAQLQPQPPWTLPFTFNTQ